MRILIILLLAPLFCIASVKKSTNSLSPQTLLVECPVNVTVQEGQKYDTSVTGFPKVINNDGGAVTITFIEIFNKGNCSNRNDLLSRIFTIRNTQGDIERCSQIIYIRHLTPSQIRIPSDTLIEYPKDKSFAQTILGLPNALGAIDITYIDTKVSNMCTIPIRIKREWSIRDKCSSDILKKTTNITLISYQNSFEQSKSVVTDLCNSEGQISLTSKGEFGPYSYLWNNGATTSSISNLSAGNYSAIITDVFKCNQLNTTTLSNISETGDIGGKITTESNYRVNPDSIYVLDNDNISKFCFSDNGGLHYAFKLKLKKSGFIDYRFVKRTQVLEGISTRDIVLIQKHILGKQLLPDTLRYFAADVNGNFNVTSSDVSELRKLLLGIKDNFTNVLPWYFFRPDWKITITKNNSFESIIFKGLTIVNYPRLNADVLAVKMGDVDLSYNNTISKLIPRSEELSEKVYMKYSILKSNELVDVPFFIHSELVGIEGLQFAIEWPIDCQNVEIINSSIDPSFFNLKGNILKVSISSGEALSFNEKSPLFVLRFKTQHSNCDPTSNIKLLGSFENEFYVNNDLLSYGLKLFHEETQSFKAYKIFPNPASEVLNVSHSSKSAISTIEIYALDGKQVYLNTFTGSLSINTTNWLNSPYYYLIKGSAGIEQRGLLLIESKN